jgi:hypothetical protein
MEFPEDYDDHLSFRLVHSGFGIASFAIALAVGLIEFVLVAIAGVLEASTPGGIDEGSPGTILLGFAVIGGLMVNVLGIGLGIAGLCQAHRRRVYAVLGVATGSLVLLGVLGLIVVGLLAG